MTLHVYSPPLLRMGAYFLDDDGVLARRAMSPEEELRPLRAARAAVKIARSSQAGSLYNPPGG